MTRYDLEHREALVDKTSGMAFYRTFLEIQGFEAWVPYGHIAYALCPFGLYERPVFAQVKKLKPGQVFVDVGANIGLISLQAAKRGCEVIAFEPEIRAREILELNFKLNQIPQRNIRAMAVGRKAEEIDFLISPDILQSSIVFTEGLKDVLREKVTVTTLDIELQVIPDGIKIDVEGAELDVLTGARATMEQMKPESWILVETHNKKKSSTRGIINHLVTAGFVCHKIDGDGKFLPIAPETQIGQIIGIKA